MGNRRADGLLLVDKPAGMTSHDVVVRARRALQLRRIGHTGTLDPFATGLLVLLVGRATRLAPYVDSEPKVYAATVRFGAATDTDDLTGSIVTEAPLPSMSAVEAALPTLTGTIRQMPPAYSAKQVGGVRSYAAARRGEALDLEPAAVTVHGWEVCAFDGRDLAVRVTCSSGTYVRALARDLGRLCASAAHLSSLRRERSGGLSLESAIPLEMVADSPDVLRPMADAVTHLPRLELSDEQAVDVAHGRSVAGDAVRGGMAALMNRGELVAIAEYTTSQWHPRLVLNAA